MRPAPRPNTMALDVDTLQHTHTHSVEKRVELGAEQGCRTKCGCAGAAAAAASACMYLCLNWVRHCYCSVQLEGAGARTGSHRHALYASQAVHAQQLSVLHVLLLRQA